MEFIVQKLVELGAYRIVPVALKRSVVHLDEKKGESAAGALAVDRRSSSEAEQAPDCAGGWGSLHFKGSAGTDEADGFKTDSYELSEGMMRTRKLIESQRPVRKSVCLSVRRAALKRQR